MTRFFALIALAISALTVSIPAAAQEFSTSRTISTERWVEEWDPASQRWVRVDDRPSLVAASAMAASSMATTTVTTTNIVNGVVIEQTQTTLPATTTQGFAIPQSRSQAGLAQVGQGAVQYGPFRVLDGKRAAIVDSTDHRSPAWFDVMLRDHPDLEVLEMIEAPGTRHDIANLKVGRKIREAGLRTHVPAGGSVRSGAVELFLAGTTRTMEEGAQFAVHSWLDNYGREPKDFPADHPANRLYLDYYEDMGMSESQAREFYAMTNSVPHSSALWLGAGDMRPWVREPRKDVPASRMYAAATPRLPEVGAFDEPLVLPEFAFDALIAIAPALPLDLPIELPAINYADLSGYSVARADATLLDS